MRTVICHFFNESYLLPWWLKHHLALFDYGIMIDHGSTDASPDIVHEMAPNWRLVRSRLRHFDAYLTDFEVMGYEQDLPGWKMVLNVTEFAMPSVPMENIERELTRIGRVGCSASGMLMVDHQPEVAPHLSLSLPAQKHWGVDDNAELQIPQRLVLGLPPSPYRNRFFHRAEVGMYHPGRHSSFHPDSSFRLLELMVFYFGYAPWNDNVVRRKLQIADKLNPKDVRRGWGLQHMKKAEELQRDYALIRASATDLNEHQHASRAISSASARYTKS
jgi:hypothetical protein